MGLVSKLGEGGDDEDELGELTISYGLLESTEPDDVVIDLGTWGAAAIAALDERLHLLEAPHAWEGTDLVVPEPSAAWVERVIEQVEDERTLELDEDGDHIAYDLAEWDDQHRALLEGRLRDDLIPFSIADDELVVLEIDEQRVDDAIDAVLAPDGEAPPAEGSTSERPEGGEARTEIMGELFVAADQLVHDPSDPDARKVLVEGATEAATRTPPYGMDRGWWRELADRLDAFSRLVGGGISAEHEDAAVAQAATALRDHLRPYV